MKFTYDAYGALIERLCERNYSFVDYSGASNKDKTVIMRHDIDFSIDKATVISSIEREHKVKSVFFVLLTSDFYNVFSKKNCYMLDKILNDGNVIGLHFDETRYPDYEGDLRAISEKIVEEKKVLERLLGIDVTCFSAHRPSKEFINSDLRIQGMINSYGREFFQEYRYLSDSRMAWREPVEDIIDSGEFDKLHILTHSFWYNKSEENIHDALINNINDAKKERYLAFSENIRNITEIIGDDEW
ncbi:MAG: hypothetical protein E7296_09735 [Lachnospiraceae bacterium]|nr:hypothetical protein [Lachnospiraceae bacterium]